MDYRGRADDVQNSHEMTIFYIGGPACVSRHRQARLLHRRVREEPMRRFVLAPVSALRPVLVPVAPADARPRGR